jgi:hypothetical protein
VRQEHREWQSVQTRSRRYLNNIIEQDHRAIKRRCAPMLAMKSFRTAAITLAGVNQHVPVLGGRARLAGRRICRSVDEGVLQVAPLGANVAARHGGDRITLDDG